MPREERYVTALNVLEVLRMGRGEATVAVQGFGNVGETTARLLHQAGIKVIAVSDVSGGLYKQEGLDIPDICRYITTGENRLLKDYRQMEWYTYQTGSFWGWM